MVFAQSHHLSTMLWWLKVRFRGFHWSAAMVFAQSHHLSTMLWWLKVRFRGFHWSAPMVFAQSHHLSTMLPGCHQHQVSFDTIWQVLLQRSAWHLEPAVSKHQLAFAATCL